jgi:hypothetical protein
MCNPVAIAAVGMVLSAAAAGYQAHAQHENAEAQADAQQKQLDYNQHNWLLEQEANKNAAQSQIDQLGVKQTQIADQGEEELTLAERENKAAEARAMVATGEMGVTGNLTDTIFGHLSLAREEQMAAIHGNIEGAMQQSQYEKDEAARRGTTVGTGPANVIMRPNATDAFIQGGLGVASAAANFASKYGGNSKPSGDHLKTNSIWNTD